jgi:DNA repair protein RecO (recombination protein O)
MPSRERSFRTDAVVLRHSDWGEADRLLWLYTREFGKVRAIAKGVRKVRSRKAGHIEPFMHSTLLLARGRDILLVTQAETVDAFMPLREDLLRATAASYIVELLDRFTYEEADDFHVRTIRSGVPRSEIFHLEVTALYRLLLDTLSRISGHRPGNTQDAPAAPVTGVVNPFANAAQRNDPGIDLAIRYYEIRLLDLIGFRPQLFTCLGCRQQIKAQDQYFSAERGGVLCPSCGRDVLEAKPVTTNVLRYLRHFQRSEWSQVARSPISPSLNREIETLVQYYLTYLLERGLNTPAFMRRVREIRFDEKDQA